MDERNHGPSSEHDSVATETTTRESESVIEAIARAVAVHKNVPQTELAPLYDRIEPEAVISLVEHAKRRDAAVRVQFRYEGYRITVSQDGHIAVHNVE